MNRKEIIDMSNPDCPVRNVLARICDKWSVLSMLVLKDSGVMRFSEIQKSIPDISQKMLTVTLRTLEEDGFVKRKIYAEVPPKVEYSLTERAQSLLPLIGSLVGWAKENMSDIIKDRKANVQRHK